MAKLLAGSNTTSRLVDGVNDPCLPGLSSQEVRLEIHYDVEGRETWDPSFSSSLSSSNSSSSPDESLYYQGILKNDGATGDFESCLKKTKELLHLEDNSWCGFAHRGDCSFNGVYMPEMPRQSESFGEFIAISNYFHVWDFLGLPARASLQELRDMTEQICSMDRDGLIHFNKQHAKIPESEINDYCFRSAYVFNVLHNGYGFEMDEFITATEVIRGQKIGWALGAMLYEINTLPWKYDSDHSLSAGSKTFGHGRPFPRHLESFFVVMTLVGIVLATIGSFVVRSRRNNRDQYLTLK